jgi:minor histocompatibility antigen H13
MVSVATSLDLPMKVLWPKSIRFSAENGNMMLGLGDIVVPGLFISLALRYDCFRHTRAQLAGSFSKPYFTASLVAYMAGLATTMGVMHVFRAAQPALLYLRCVHLHIELPSP